MSGSSLLFLSGALLFARSAAAAICYDGYGYSYNCYGGLSYGARIGIGIAIAAGVLLLFMFIAFWRRRQLKSQWAKYRPPALPTQGGPSGPYANNPPPPQGYYGQQSSFNGPNPYGNNPPPPPQTYQPSMAGMYGNNTGNVGRNDTGTTVDMSGKSGNGNGYNGYQGGGGGEDHEHGYEWAQAREQERLERERMGAEAPPPGYDVSANSTGTGGYAPPPGAPPTKRAGGTV
ncbi:hypothetical protein EHS25_006744 [Saitozyma podzolica]|uniref:Chitin synthase, class 3 n=1 Tax=Saitozyma podzolica TaxID=1890683 RepID=A0A427YSK0_9TREE|nr:hypothetical protein EHS25_006744 [Saitozyma podzolica]